MELEISTKQQFIERLCKKRRSAHYDGNLIDCDNDLHMAIINAMSLNYDLVDDPEFKDLLTTKSELTGETINCINHICHSTEDLNKKQNVPPCSLLGCWRLYSAQHGLSFSFHHHSCSKFRLSLGNIVLGTVAFAAEYNRIQKSLNIYS